MLDPSAKSTTGNPQFPLRVLRALRGSTHSTLPPTQTQTGKKPSHFPLAVINFRWVADRFFPDRAERNSNSGVTEMRAFLLSAILPTAICVSVSASAAIWYVDGSVSSSGDGKSWETALKTIQGGINAASLGDTVLVAEGTYLENIQFDGKNIILTSTDPLDSTVVANTVIDGNGARSVVMFDSTEEESCVLSGFTIRNGRAEAGPGIRGGSEELHTHATIQNNVISGNTGVGLQPVYGGAVAFCDGAIQNNTISDNSGDYGYGCGLIACNGTIRHNLITRNSGRGGLVDCNGTIVNNRICGNLTSGVGHCNGTFQNNTVAGNAGTGLYSCSATIRNCIIWGNRTLPGRQIGSSSEPSYCCIQDWTGGGTGNIRLAPHFVDTENGDFHLQSWSPCVDAGDPASAFSEEPQPNGGRVNMGAYGNTPEAASGSPDTDSDELPDEWELHWFGDLRENGAGDPDSDYISNLTEYHHARNPNSAADPRTNNATKDTWYVSIQEALSGCDDGDEILV